MSAGSLHNAMNYLGAPKWPRQYMTEILALPTREERRKALQAIPAHLRDWVEYLVRDQMSRPRKTKNLSP